MSCERQGGEASGPLAMNGRAGERSAASERAMARCTLTATERVRVSVWCHVYGGR